LPYKTPFRREIRQSVAKPKQSGPAARTGSRRQHRRLPYQYEVAAERGHHVRGQRRKRPRNALGHQRLRYQSRGSAASICCMALRRASGSRRLAWPAIGP